MKLKKILPFITIAISLPTFAITPEKIPCPSMDVVKASHDFEVGLEKGNYVVMTPFNIEASSYRWNVSVRLSAKNEKQAMTVGKRLIENINARVNNFARQPLSFMHVCDYFSDNWKFVEATTYDNMKIN